MKGGQNLAVLKQKKEEEDGWVIPQPCCICKKVIKGAYGNHNDGWTCSGACERAYNLRPKYPGHSEEEFFQRQEVQDEVLHVFHSVSQPLGVGDE